APVSHACISVIASAFHLHPPFLSMIESCKINNYFFESLVTLTLKFTVFNILGKAFEIAQ
ncbi:MAG: hypothetical protein MR935_06115, partial [Agathobaculum sp.]|uniref:hypothetical protein n=1 Tax=Agathobaculum sp. TaxID=2048138 RepID=UPI0025C07180